MSDFLTEMAETSALRARATRRSVGRAGLDRRVAAAPPPATLDLDASGFDIIAEAKLASPSDGRLVTGDTGSGRVVSLARSYVSVGAAAVSVLTEPTRFSGSLEHLEAVAEAVPVPVMRKDFLVDPIQVIEARASGASGVLLIARMLSENLLVEMTDLARSLGMFVLVEVFDTADLEQASVVFERHVLVGVNCRDLATLGIDRTRFETLAPHLPHAPVTVAESGLTTPEEVASVADLGYRMALVGSSLVSAVTPETKLEQMLAAGRSVLDRSPS